MTSNLENGSKTTAGTEVEAAGTNNWQLNALTEALGDLSLTVNDSLSVGRGSDNDVVLGSKEVSRNHALLSVSNGKLYLKDLNSSNGTFVNEQRIESNKSEQIKADDTVGFASFAFQVMAPIAAAMDTATSLEQPVEPIKTDEVPADLEPVDTDISANSVFEEAVSADVIDNSVTEPEINVEVEPVTSLPVITEDTVDATNIKTDVVKGDTVENNAKKDDVVEDSSVRNSNAPEDVISASQTDEPVVKETVITEILSSTANDLDTPVTTVADVEPDLAKTSVSMPSKAAEQETVTPNDTYKKPVSQEVLNNKALNKESLDEAPVSEQPVTIDPVATSPVVSEPLVKEPTVHKEPVVLPEHDKTTKTELQEEADPDVLRAKQAATGQLTGTANLGQARDLGTEGNNAMDQAISNTANEGHLEKKPSGAWFIWVFIAIIIIGLALWLFNMGGA